MPTTSDLALVDTNVFVHAFYSDRPEHPASVQLRDKAQAFDAGLCLSPQNLIELYAVITNPKRVSAPLQPAEALAEIDKLFALPGLALLPVPSDVAQRTTELLRRRPVPGAKAYDLQLIATMLGNGVRRIYTFNTKDFVPFAELEVLLPPAIEPGEATSTSESI